MFHSLGVVDRPGWSHYSLAQIAKATLGTILPTVKDFNNYKL